MSYTEKLISEYNELARLLDEDRDSISKCLKGDLLEEYRKIVDKECDIIQSNKRTLYNKI